MSGVIEHYARALDRAPNAPPLHDPRYAAACRIQMEAARRDVKCGRWVENPCFEPWTPRIAEKLATAQSFMDVGAERGFYTFLAQQRMSADACIVAIEPDPIRSALLTQQFARCPRTRVYRAAAWDESGTAMLVKPSACSATSAVVEGEVFRVPTLTLDEVVGRENVDLVKIDVEGAEARVLTGMTQTLERQRPEIFLEYHPWSEQILAGSQMRIARLLQDAQYRIFRIDDGSLRETRQIGGRMWLVPY